MNQTILKEYRESADAVRCGDESPEALLRLEKAEAALREERKAQRALQPAAATKPGWWNLPVAASCWEGDARDTGA
jgi:hypothetical protein